MGPAGRGRLGRGWGTGTVVLGYDGRWYGIRINATGKVMVMQ